MKSIRFVRLIASFLFVVVVYLSLVACHQEKEFTCQNNAVNFAEREQSETSIDDNPEIYTFILNTNSKKIHTTTCGTGDLISPENRRGYRGGVEELFSQGYTYCGNCFK